MSRANPAVFTEPVDGLSAVYFTMTVFTTVRFGDITPVTGVARIPVTVQMVFALGLLIGLGRVVTRATHVGRARRERGTEA